MCIVFIFIYSLGYSLSFGPASWVYGSEVCLSTFRPPPPWRSLSLTRPKIFPTSLRARGLNFAASGGAIGSIVVAQVWPVGIDRIGSKIYFFFMAINVVCVPVCISDHVSGRRIHMIADPQTIYLFYPETKGLALEDMDALFDTATTVYKVPPAGQSSSDRDAKLV